MRLVLALVLGAILGTGAGRGAEMTSEQLAAKAQDSLVFIATRYFDANTNQTKPAGSGSGVVITPSGLVLTAYHVVKDWNAQSDDDKQENPLRIRLGSSHGDEVDAQIVGVNDQYDVALLQILRPGTYAASGVCFANALAPGESVTGFGFPDGLERQSSPGTFGNASADNGRWAVSFNNAEGMSGGPLYDRFGDVVGIIRGTYGGQGASNVVTPVRRARSLIEDQTRFTEECLRDTSPEPAPAPASINDWYGGSLWKDPDDLCGDIEKMVATTTDLGSLHYSDSGKPVADVEYGEIKENLLFTAASNGNSSCSIQENGDPTVKDHNLLTCDINISSSIDTMQSLLDDAGADLGACMRRLKWTPGDVSKRCALSPDGLGCFYDWRKGGRAAELYGFWSGDPTTFGIGIYVSFPDRR